MKKTLLFFMTTILSAGFIFGAPKSSSKNPNLVENQDGSFFITEVDKDPSVKFNQKYEGQKNVTVINGAKVTKPNPITIDLSDFEGKDIYVEFSCELKFSNSKNSELDLIWMINDIEAGLPTVSQKKAKVDEWVKFEGETALSLGAKKSLYLSGAGMDKENITFYLKNLKVKFTGDGLSKNAPAPASWTAVPSIKETYAPYFTIGLACEFNPEVSKKAIQKGIAYHADSITPGNEFKPDGIFYSSIPKGEYVDFVAEDGKTYKMPANMPNFGKMKPFLLTAKAMGVKVRGHVLVWHSQTPAWFFREDFNRDKNAPLVDKATMTARQEWYIKSVLEYVNKIEKESNNGEHIIYAWDVVNEAVADNANDTHWLREDSDWFRIYGDETFIVNAFRFANKYAPADVKLVYNDYGCYGLGKRKAICKLIDIIKANPEARLDALGMQSHVNMDLPVTGPNSYEEALQMFLEHGVDVQVTELDIGTGIKSYSSVLLKAKYKQFFKMFIENRATEDKKGITGVTIWGVTDDRTWLNGQKEYQGKTQYPLLFNEDFTCKPAFYGVLEAAEQK